MAPDHWDLGRWNRIPVTMHWTVLLSFAWLYWIFSDLLATAIGSVALFALFVAHQFGHAWLLRRKKVPISGITLNGIHGETTYDYVNARDAAIIAWGGVLAQAVILVLAVALPPLMNLSAAPMLVWIILGPILFVFTKVNIFLMLIALLPIGPFDGREAWSLIPLMRSALRRRINEARNPKLTPEQRRDLEAKSHAEAANLLDRLTKKSDKEDA